MSSIVVEAGPNQDSKQALREITHWIDGQRIAGASGRFGEVFNPAKALVQARLP